MPAALANPQGIDERHRGRNQIRDDDEELGATNHGAGEGSRTPDLTITSRVL